MLTHDEAYAATNPNDPEERREAAAQAIMAGAAANAQYWDHRSDLEALRAQAEGHGVIARGPDEEGESPTAVGSGTAATPDATIEGTATEEPPTALAPGESATPANASDPASVAPVPSPDNPNEAIARLRQQLQDAGINPEA